jgi:hypothetical protein
MSDSLQFPFGALQLGVILALQCGRRCLRCCAASGRVVQRGRFNRPIRRGQAQTRAHRAQHGIGTDERLRRTRYRAFLREPGDYFLRPVAYPRSLQFIDGLLRIEEIFVTPSELRRHCHTCCKNDIRYQERNTLRRKKRVYNLTSVEAQTNGNSS